MAHPIFDIPDILRLIFEHLSDAKLHTTRLLLVSRQFFLCALPFAWESIDGSRELFRLLFAITNKEISDAWINNLKPLDDRSLERFNLYAPRVKRVTQVLSSSSDDKARWIAILKAVPARPLLPNLEHLTFAANDLIRAPNTQTIGALVCPTIVGIRVLVFEQGSAFPRSILSSPLMAEIADLCPEIRHVEFYARRRGRYSSEISIPGPFNPFGQIRSLRTLGIGPEVLSYDVFMTIGSLPNLESLMVSNLDYEPERMFPGHLPVLPNGFLALRHLSWFNHSLAVASRLWKILPCIPRLTSVSITVKRQIHDGDDTPCDLVSSVCRVGPNITDLHLEFDSIGSMLEFNLFTPVVVDHLSHLPLQRMRILTPDADLLPPDSYEKLTLALSNVEYLEIPHCGFTFNGIECVAKNMPRLQFLEVHSVSIGWLSIEELPQALSFSPSILCLQSRIITDTGGPIESTSEYIDLVSTALHRLWPNGVHCIFSDFNAPNARRSVRDGLVAINANIKRLCYPHEFNTPDMFSASQWQYINQSNMHWFDKFGTRYQT